MTLNYVVIQNWFRYARFCGEILFIWNVNVLSKSTAPFNDVVGTHTLRAYQVRISKADSAPEGIWQKPEDFVNWLPLGKA